MGRRQKANNGKARGARRRSRNRQLQVARLAFLAAALLGRTVPYRVGERGGLSPRQLRAFGRFAAESGFIHECRENLFCAAAARAFTAARVAGRSIVFAERRRRKSAR